MTLPDLAAVYYSQWDPDHVGKGDCVPTSAKMLLRYYIGEEVEIGDLRSEMDMAPDGVRNLARDAGITLEACRQILTERGVPSIAVFARDLDFDELVGYVLAGRVPIIFIEYAHISNRMDHGFPPERLHAVWLTGMDGEVGWLKDPDRWGPDRAGAFYTLPGELRVAWDTGARLGGGAIIPNLAREEEDDLNDEERRMLRQIHEALYPGEDAQSVFTKVNDAVAAIDVGIGRLQRNIDVERGGPIGSFDPAKPPIDPRIENP